MTKNFTSGTEGVFYDMPDADYRKLPGVSNSMLKHIATDGSDVGSPAHFKLALDEASFDSDALFIGRMVHSLILTPTEPLPSVVEQPESYASPAGCSAVKAKKCNVGDPLPWHGAATYCKDWTAAQEKAGLRVLTRQQLEDINGIVNAVACNPIARMALERGKAEVSLSKGYQRDGRHLLRKARLDWVPSGPSLVDIKTTMDARKDEFAKSFFKFRYYVQAAFYLDLWNELNPDDQKTNFVFIAVEKFAPYAVSVFDVAPRAIETGRAKYQADLNVLLTCMETDSWPAYGDDVQGLDLPAYAYKKGLDIYAA